MYTYHLHVKIDIGQTKDSLSTRVTQNQAAMRLMQPEKLTLAEHINVGHQLSENMKCFYIEVHPCSAQSIDIWECIHLAIGIFFCNGE